MIADDAGQSAASVLSRGIFQRPLHGVCLILPVFCFSVERIDVYFYFMGGHKPCGSCEGMVKLKYLCRISKKGNRGK